MATITKRAKGWYVQIRRKGFPAQNRTFPSKVAAVAWARQTEAQLDHSGQTVTCYPKMTFRALLERYSRTITPTKRGASSEAYRLSRLMASPLASLDLADLKPVHLANYRDERLRTVKPGTVRREMGIIRSVLEVGRREWGLSVSNPAAEVSRPIANDARDRRLRAGEWERIEEGLRIQRNEEVGAFLRLSLETALRRGELLRLCWENIDLERRVALIPETKTGRSRTIPLTPQAIRVLTAFRSREGSVFTVTESAIRQAWTRLCRRAGIIDLRVHDLRHEALSRLTELGLNTPELAAVSGHRDVRMLLRYTHVQPTALAAKLATLLN